MTAFINKAIAIVILTVVISTVATIWLAFDFPTMEGFWGIILPAIFALSQVPVIGTFVSIVAWVVTFELAMFITRLVVWVGGAIQGSLTQPPVH